MCKCNNEIKALFVIVNNYHVEFTKNIKNIPNKGNYIYINKYKYLVADIYIDYDDNENVVIEILKVCS